MSDPEQMDVLIEAVEQDSTLRLNAITSMLVLVSVSSTRPFRGR